MVQFNELRLTPDAKHMIVDVSVIDMPYYDDVYISALCFDTQESFTPLGPSQKAIYPPECQDLHYKRFRAYIEIDTLQDNLFFIYVITSGSPAPDTPCDAKDPVTMGIVYDKCPFYNNLMSGIRNIGDDCNPSQQLLNDFFRYNAFQMAISTGNYTEAVNYWNRFFSKKKQTKFVKSCGCHG